MPRVLVAQIGARRHYAVARALHHRGLLALLVTDACAETYPWRTLKRVIPNVLRPRPLQRLLGRTVHDVPRDRLCGLPWFALSSLWETRSGETSDRWVRRNADFGRRVTGGGFGEANTVYAFNGAALEIFEAARRKGLRTVLDQTAAPWRWNRSLLEEEAKGWPGWEDSPTDVDLFGGLAAREEAEWSLADRIICGSAFAASALGETGAPQYRCSIVSYPSPRDFEPATAASKRGRDDRSLRVLFVGTLQLRKGVQYLLEAVKLLTGEGVRVRLVGPSRLSDHALRQLREHVEVVGSVPRSEIEAHYRWADVFVLPTLSEGSANVCHEAMATGLPVITTAHAGSAVRHEENGLLVPIRDPVALADAIRRVRDDPDLWTRLSGNARSGTHHRSLEEYAADLAMAIETSPASQVEQS